MTEIQNQLERYYTYKPVEFNILEALTLSQKFDSTGTMSQALSVVLSHKSTGNKLLLTFTGVRKLEFKQPTLSQITFWIEILDGRELPMVESRYLVRDPEQERVLFFERADFEVESK